MSKRVNNKKGRRGIREAGYNHPTKRRAGSRERDAMGNKRHVVRHEMEIRKETSKKRWTVPLRSLT